MKRKSQRIGSFLSLVLALVTLGASCAIWTTGSDSGTTISMSFSPSSKALGEGATEVRVWVYSNNKLVPNPANSEGYYSAQVSGTGDSASATVTIGELPPGQNYRVVAVAGKPQGDISFLPTAFGSSASTFGIKPGVETAVDLELSPVTIAAGLANVNLKSVVVAGNTIHAASETALYAGSAVNSMTSIGWNTSANGTINSLNLTSDAEPVVLVNTSKGVRNTSGNLVGQWDGTPPSVLQSGGIASLSTYFFQGDKAIGGYVGEGTWNVIDLDLPISGKPVLDLLVYQEQETIYGFFATRVVGAFRIGSNQIKDIDLDQILSGSDSSGLTFFGDTVPLIQAFGYLGGSSTDLYLGTKSGIYKTNVNTPKTTKPTLIEGSKGLNVTKIVTYGNMEGFLTSTEIVVLKGDKLYKLPFLTTVIGELTDIAWQGTKLIVTGTKGICSVDTASLQ